MRGVSTRDVHSSLLSLLPLVFALMLGQPAHGNTANDLTVPSTGPARLVFGSFAQEQNAQSFAARVSRLVSWPVTVAIGGSETDRLYRVVGPVVSGTEQVRQAQMATAAGLDWWRLLGAGSQVVGAIAPQAVGEAASQTVGAVAPQAVPVSAGLAVTLTPQGRNETKPQRQTRSEFDVDVGVQNRVFAGAGSNRADQYQYSASANLNYSADFRDGLDGLRVQLFGRWDSDDSQRSHTDVRELSWTHVFTDTASSWQLQAGIGQVFWGVTEFNHLIDVVNQTDLVENPDGEQKLGQPLVSLTNIRRWGTLELFVLPGFRERLFPGLDGRLALALPIDSGATRYESGAEDKRVDGVARLSTLLGGLAVDVYHFNGTRRTPRFEAGIDGSQLVLVPVYDTIKRTALAAQANSGDTAFKLEAYTQRGGPESYFAAVAGLEHTLVGAFGGSADLGLVLEYNHDSRGGRAFDSFLERDLAIGARLAANDLNDSQALLGVVWDTKSNERSVLLEASRRLNDRWSLELEGRWFGGGTAIGRSATLGDLLDNNNKLGSLQRDDYIQFEFTRYF